MQIKQSVVSWSIIFIVLGVFIYLVSNVLFPFVFAAVVAYFLDPITDKIEEAGVSRNNSTLIVIGSFGVIFGLTAFFLGPIFVEQFKNLAAKIPQIFNEFEFKQGTKISTLVSKYAPGFEQKVQDFSYKFSVQIVQFIAISLQNLVTSGAAIFNFLSLIIISPVVAFYLLRDWDLMVKKIDDLLPRNKLLVIRNEFSKIDGTVSAYIRGQVTVCIIMGIFYAVNLSFIKLEYAVAIGIMAGVLTFIPYIGMAVSLILALLIALLQFTSMDGILFVLFIFGLGNLIEGNFITPKLVGDKVNLHPVWIIFGLLAGGSLMGLTGIMIAIPLTAIVGVLVRSALTRYKNSTLYLGYPIMALESPNHNRHHVRREETESQNRAAEKQKVHPEAPKNADVFGFENSHNNSPRKRGRPPKKVD